MSQSAGSATDPTYGQLHVLWSSSLMTNTDRLPDGGENSAIHQFKNFAHQANLTTIFDLTVSFMNKHMKKELDKLVRKNPRRCSICKQHYGNDEVVFICYGYDKRYKLQTTNHYKVLSS